MCSSDLNLGHQPSHLPQLRPAGRFADHKSIREAIEKTAPACQDLIRKGTVSVPDAVYQPGFEEEGVDAAIGSIVGASAGIVVRGVCDDADPVGFRRRTLEDFQVRVDDRLVQCMAGVQVPAVSSVQGLLLQVRQEERPEAMEGALGRPSC